MKYPYSSYNTPLPGYGTSLVDRINLYLHFRRYFKLITERWLLLAICSAAGLGLGLWIAYNKADVYRSGSSLSLPARVVTANRNTRIDEDTQKFTETQIALMESGPVMLKVMAKLQEGRDNTNKLARPELVKAQPYRGSTFMLTVESTNQAYAQSFARAWADEFIAYKRSQKQGAISVSEISASKQIMEAERRLTQDREQLTEFKRLHNIANPKDAGLAKREELQRAKDTYNSYLTQITVYENANGEAIASGAIEKKGSEPKVAPRLSAKDSEDSGDESNPNRFDGFSNYSNYKIELNRLQNLRIAKAREMKDKHPVMVALDQQIELKKKDIQQALELADQYRKAKLASLKKEASGYEPLIKDLNDKVFELTQTENDFEALVNKELQTKGELERLQRTLADIKVMGADDEQFSVLDYDALDSTKPVRPKRWAIVVTGLLIGSLLGVGVLFLLNRLDDRLDTPEDIEEQLEEPILGQLPEVEKKHYKEGYLLLTRMKTHTMFAESLRGVRSALLLSPEGTSKRMLAVTSAVPGDGKTTFTTNFAVTLALAGNRTLLIDADLRRGNIHGYFEQPLEGGFSEVLQNKLGLMEAIRETGIHNLSFMRAGERPANPSELLIGSGTRELIMKLRQEFDYVIFDCPPLTAIDDTFSIAAYLDGLFFVVRAGRTSIRFARMGLNTIRQRGAPILGLIVNGVPIDNPYYYYTTYYYASYYHRPIATGDTVVHDRKRKQIEIDVPASGSSRRQEREHDSTNQID